MKISDLVTMIIGSALLVLPSCIISTIFSSFILALPLLVTDSIFSKFPMVKKFCFIIHATILGCLVTAISLGYGNDTIVATTPGIVLGYVISIITNYSETVSGYNKEIALKKLNNELFRIPKRINKFILAFGYKDVSFFKSYVNDSSAFKRTRKFKGIQFTTEYGISTDIFSKTLELYQTRVNQDFQNHLSQLIPMLQVFGIDDLYELSPAFQDYYHVKSITEQISEQTQNVEDIVVEKQILFLQTMNPYEKLEKAANIVIVEMINQGFIEHIPQSGLYKSTKPDDFFSSKDVPGSLVEGTTSEMSIYD